MLMVVLLFVIVAVVRKENIVLIDFNRIERDIPGKVTTIEYDPNRNVRIGWLYYENGAKTLYFYA